MYASGSYMSSFRPTRFVALPMHSLRIQYMYVQYIERTNAEAAIIQRVRHCNKTYARDKL